MSQQQQKSSSKASKKDEKPKQDGDDLTTLLDASQRNDLTLLVAQCTDGMRKVLLDNFNASAGLSPEFLQEGMTDEEKMMNANVNADVSEYEKEKKLKADAEKDIATSKMKSLKKNVLKAYDEWRERVLMRIGEVIDTKETATKQLRRQSTSSDPKPAAPHTSGAVKEGNQKSNLRFKDLFPPTKTPLTKLPMNKRTLTLHSVLLLLISLENYAAWSRVLMLNLTSSMKLSLKTFEQEEYVLAKGLLEQAKELTADDETKKKQEETKDNRRWKVNLATAAGAAVVGVAGGLAAPLIATGVGSIMGGLGLGATAAAGYLGSVAGSTMLVGSLFGAYGGRMTGQMMDKYAREVEDFEFLPIHSNKKTSEDQKEGAKQASEHDHKLRVTICISGWLTEKEEVVKPWRVLGTGAEVFALKWELEALLNLGHAMDGMVKSAAWGYAQKQLVAQTIFADLMAAMWPVGLLKVARVLDNPFSVAKNRADKAGEVLADALINKAQGERPVTLIGYSLGARVIYTCLMSLAQRKAFGLVENAVLIGAPTPSDTSDWRILRTAVSGRLVNVYSENDYLLGFMYRTSALQYGVAGLQKVGGLAGVENVDVSEDIDGHTRYRFLVGGILKKIGFEDIDTTAVQEERETMDKILKEEKKQSLRSQRNRLLRRESYNGKENEDEEAEHEASQMEKGVKEATEKSLVTRAIEWWYTPKANTKDAETVASNLQKAINNPSDAKGAIGDTAQDIHASTQSYTSYVTSMLPSMPGRSPTSVQKTAKPANASAKAKQETSKSGASKGYVEQAQGYLPDRSSLPSMPFGRNPKKPEKSQPAKATEKVTDTGKATANVASNVGTEVVKPTIDNTLNPKDNPAVKATKDVTKKAPIIHQASDKIPGANKAADVTSSTVGTTVQNTTSTVGGLVNTTASKGAEAGSGAASTATNAASGAASKATDAGKAATGNKEEPKANKQSYMSRAAGYAPSMPSMRNTTTSKGAEAGPDAASTATNAASGAASKATDVGKAATGKKEEPKTNEQSYMSRAAGYAPSMPSMPSWGGAKKKPPKLQSRSSGMQTPQSTPSKPEPKKTDSGVKSPPPKLGSRTPSTQSGNLKSPAPKLDKMPSGLKSPPDTLERLPSGVKSPVANAPKKVSGAPQQAMKAGGDAAGKTMKTGTDAAGKASQTGQQAAKQGGGYLSSAGSAVTNKLPGFGRS